MTRKSRTLDPINTRPSAGTDHIGRRLRGARMFAGLTQIEVARRLGVQQSAVSRIENEPDMRISTIQRYLGVLGAGIDLNARFDASAIDDLGVPHDDQTIDGQFIVPILGDCWAPQNREFIFSVKPRYSQKIETGEKTVELRRRFPKYVPEGTIALIYSTSPTRALTGIAEIEGVEVGTPSAIWSEYAERACIGRNDFDTYFSGADCAHAIKLRSARPLRRSLDLTELRERFGFEPPQSYRYAKPELREALRHEWGEISDRHQCIHRP
ncbi:helix-turn-helix domain-containing protein [Erythrobacteraceae bacterium WH01K]|nr:helix-turn-helix domain-containing protein [Erythrobacteraceae bacterium WH01K]